ncbi:sigma-54 interaction domain-containing protein [Pseudomonas sp. CCC3.1]|uniref:sigma-54 interaction domain-containing protein n=1 Tax=Pseudomonas sp. CCC3.1 TaxID=3048607 RepID=UPI002AC98A71|nr:sigma 54-interacting transcriptional regulator [Pseudomonas sp. CCC3.1]MEB0206052.1 sigma 54-interacting transcriptional regulator [Pseudomonas sp. CCC3.1]WPX36718.1 sigma 54-interacting transcriptional regulator [Pseudomonas sp. CCC3.1]
MFTHVANPLPYAESLLQHFASVAGGVDVAAVAGLCTRAAAQLSACELSQLYVLDATHKHLELTAEWFEGRVQPVHAKGLTVDYTGEQLLQFSVCQNRVISITDLNDGLHDTGFLPAQGVPWRSLLCVPLLNAQQAVEGVLLAASREPIELSGHALSLGALGAFVCGQIRLRQQGVQSVMPPGLRARAAGLIGNSAAMRQACHLINKVVHSAYTVLLLGETGTGKEVVARAIHDGGPRRAQPFIVQNCAAFPAELLESELFGYRKGAFTGAGRDRIGLFDSANGGTLLLDEIGDMPLSLQAKLLRVLQEGEIRPLGSNDTHKIDVRIIAATHRDLEMLVGQGLFREDLYYRLAQFPIALPALRRREGDILDLARHFATHACAFLQRKPVLWSECALNQLANYAFPGNVRELKGLVERAVLLCDGDELHAEHFSLPSDACPKTASLSLRERMEQVERGLLLDCLRKNAGNQTRAAHELGVARRTLLYRLERLNISLDDIKRRAS